MAGTFKCTIYGHFRALNLKILLTHYNIAHGNDLNLQVNVELVDARKDIRSKNILRQRKATITGMTSTLG